MLEQFESKEAKCCIMVLFVTVFWKLELLRKGIFALKYTTYV